MKKIIAILLICVMLLPLVACSFQCPAIGKWETRYTKSYGEEHNTLLIEEGGYARWDLYITESGQTTHPNVQTYEWTYNNGTIKMVNQNRQDFYFYDAATDTLKDEAGHVYNRIG